jgi:hypothetical protein
MSNELRALLHKQADQHYEEIMRVLPSLITDMFRGSAPARPAAAPTTKRRRSSPEEKERVLATVIETLKGHPRGLRLEGLRDVLRLDKATLSRAIHLGLTSDQITKTGERRATTYFAAVPPSKAQDEGRVVKRKRRS